jgi:hypothetical protein
MASAVDATIFQYNHPVCEPPENRMMDMSPLHATLARIERDNRSGQSLLLYALVKTLSIPQGGHNYLLTKLKEMNPDSRQLAYGLMELMAQGATATEEWKAAERNMDRAIAG